MSSDPITPDTLGPKVVDYLDWLVERAEALEGQPALGPIVEDMCDHYRALAICLFADDGNADDFFSWLLHAPLARKHYLVTVPAGAPGEARNRRASFVAPVLDALVCRQWKLAEELSALVSPTWLVGEEYEEDFCLAEFLRRTLADADTHDVLERWRKALEGGQDKRLDVAVGLAAKDAPEFEAAVRGLLRANEARARSMTDPSTPSILASDYPFAPNRWISIEGLAFLALADKGRIATDYELQGCPAALRAGSYPPFRPRAYPHLGLA
jgi:hypothetical protein